jgi:hypothetical protein
VGSHLTHFFLQISTRLSWGSWHTKNQHPRLSRSQRKVRDGEREREITVLIEATSFAMQPFCNVAWVAHALRSDQHLLQITRTLTPYMRPLKQGG